MTNFSETSISFHDSVLAAAAETSISEKGLRQNSFRHQILTLYFTASIVIFYHRNNNTPYFLTSVINLMKLHKNIDYDV